MIEVVKESKELIEEFGIYEDSIVEQEHFLHHSVLSPLMNIGFLTFNYIIEKSIEFAQKMKFHSIL